MRFTIVRSLDYFPSGPTLLELAEKNHVRVTGDRQTGSFACRSVHGDYQFSDGGAQGKFTGHGVTGEFAFASGEVSVTVIEKPFWLPESLLKRKIAEGLEKFVSELACGSQAERPVGSVSN